MHTFNDTLGRTWTVTINVDAIRRVRALLDINLLDAHRGKLLERLVTDPVPLCDILFALVQPEAHAKNISDDGLCVSRSAAMCWIMRRPACWRNCSIFPERPADGIPQGAGEAQAAGRVMAIETATQRLESDELERKMAAALKTASTSTV